MTDGTNNEERQPDILYTWSHLRPVAVIWAESEHFAAPLEIIGRL